MGLPEPKVQRRCRAVETVLGVGFGGKGNAKRSEPGPARPTGHPSLKCLASRTWSLTNGEHDIVELFDRPNAWASARSSGYPGMEIWQPDRLSLSMAFCIGVILARMTSSP